MPLDNTYVICYRTNSIHHPYKNRAHRTSSDGPIYNLRRRLVSCNTDPSDTSSEISSEDFSKTADDNNGKTC